jgi:hypothetical protein
MSTFRNFLHRWQEPVIWMPIALVALLVAFYAIPSIDPRSGVDGFGAIWNALIVIACAGLAGFVAWLLQVTYFRELHDDDERDLADNACGIERDAATGKPVHFMGPTSWKPIALLLLDRLTWFAIFSFVFAALLGWH